MLNRFIYTGLILLSLISLRAQTNDLMIVEYVDWNPGSGWAIKVYNPTSSAINLSNYYVQVFNGSNTTATGSEQLGGTLASGASIIISNANNGQASSDFKACADDVRTNLVGVNNDDCIALTLGNSTNFVDMVGLYGVAVKNQVNGVSNALKWQKLVRDNGNCIRYSATDGSSPNSWPSSASVSLGGWTVLAPTCLSTGNNYSPFAVSQVQNQTICAGDSFLFNNQYLQQAGTYFDTLANAGACGQIVRLNLSLQASPSAQRSYQICPGDSILLYQKWYSRDTTFSERVPNLVSCDSLIDIEIRLREIEADFDWQYLDADSSNVQFVDLSRGAIQAWYWNFGDGDSSTLREPQHEYEAGNYVVKLTVIDSNGCRQQVFYPLSISDGTYPSPILPNFFSPNGDFQNDDYHLNTQVGPANFHIIIVNRNGNPVFESNDPAFRWDGKNQGQPLCAGTYFVQVQWGDKLLKNFVNLQR